jgi:hypothetical protein
MIEIQPGGTLHINSASIVEGSSMASTHLVGLPVALAILGKSVIKDYQVTFVETSLTPLTTSTSPPEVGRDDNEPTTNETTNPYDGPDEKGLFPGQIRPNLPDAENAGPEGDVQLPDGQPECKT